MTCYTSGFCFGNCCVNACTFMSSFFGLYYRNMKVIIQKAPNSMYENDGHNNSALHLAAQMGHREIAERLLKVQLFDSALSARYVHHYHQNNDTFYSVKMVPRLPQLNPLLHEKAFLTGSLCYMQSQCYRCISSTQ